VSKRGTDVFGRAKCQGSQNIVWSVAGQGIKVVSDLTANQTCLLSYICSHLFLRQLDTCSEIGLPSPSIRTFPTFASGDHASTHQHSLSS